MINLNFMPAALNATGMFIQNGLNTDSTSVNQKNFQSTFGSLLMNLYDSENIDSINAERVSVAQELASDTAVKDAVLKTATALDLMGSIKDIASQDINTIKDNAVVKQVMSEYNFTGEQQQLFIKGVRFVAVEITINDMMAAMEADKHSASALLGLQPVDSAEEVSAPWKPAGNDIFYASRNYNSGGNANVPSNPTEAFQNASGEPVKSSIQPSAFKPAPGQINPVSGEAKVIPAGIIKPAASGTPKTEPVPVTPGSEKTAPAKGTEIKIPTTAKPADTEAQEKATAEVKKIIEEMEKSLLSLRSEVRDFIISNKQVFTENPGLSNDAAALTGSLRIAEVAVTRVMTAYVSGKSPEKAVPAAAKSEAAIAAEKLYAVAAAVENFVGSFSITNNKGALQEPLNISVNETPKQPASDFQTGSGTNSQATAQNFKSAVKEAVAKIVAFLQKMDGSIEIKTFSAYEVKTSAQPVITSNNGAGIPVAQSTPKVDAVTVEQEMVISAKGTSVKHEPEIVVSIKPDNTGMPAPDTVKSVPAKEVTVPVDSKTVPADTGDGKNINAAMAEAANNAAAAEKVNTVERGKYGNAEDFKRSFERFTAKETEWIMNNMPETTKETSAEAKITAAQQVIEQLAGHVKSAGSEIIVKQIVEHIQAVVQVAKQTEIKISLRPENLGPVYIKLENRDKAITGKIHVATNEVKEVLRANVADLKAALENLGFNVQNFEISLLNDSLADGRRENMPEFEWDGGVLQQESENKIGSAGITGADGYLNYLA